MKRRDFLRHVGVTAAMSGLPAPALSAGATAPVVPYGMTPYMWAKYTARINKRLTPQMLTRFCGFSESEAARMIRRLTFENVLMAPDSSGVSRTSGDVLAKAQRRREAVQKMLKAVRERVDEAVETAFEDAPETEK